MEYELKENPELAFTRLNWAVEEVENLEGQLLIGVTVDTNKSWVGVLDREILGFGLIEPKGFFNLKFFQLVVKGKIHQINDGSKLYLKIKLSLYTFLTFLGIYALTFLLTYDLIMQGDISNLFGWIMWMLIFPVIGTVMLRRKIKQTEKKIQDLFGIGSK